MTIEWDTTLPDRGAHLWQWGHRVLWVDATGAGVSVATVVVEEPAHRLAEPCAEPPAEPLRFVRPQGAPLQLTVRAADRPIVARPAMPLTILGGATTPLYVSSPAWVGVGANGSPFFEVPTTQPSSTWFGATPQAGVLAYANRTRARVRFDQVEPDPGRILTRVMLINTLPDPWAIERLEVPMTHLPLFRSSAALWSAGLRIERTKEADIDVGLEQRPPSEAGTVDPLCPPRITGSHRLTLRALSVLGWS